jgi:hypothetical protein
MKKYLTINTILMLVFFSMVIIGMYFIYMELTGDNRPDFDFRQPVEVVNKNVELGGYLSLKATRCRYTDKPALITRALIYPDGKQIVIKNDSDPSIKRYQPNCLQNGKRLELDEAIDKGIETEVPAKIFIPSIITGEIADQPVPTGCGIVLRNNIFTSRGLLGDFNEYSYDTGDFCLVAPQTNSEILNDVDVFIES